LRSVSSYGRSGRAGLLSLLAAPAGQLAPSRHAADPDGVRNVISAKTRPDWVEVVFCLAAFAMLCVTVLCTPPRLLEPDDYAYQGSVVALSHGHLTLSSAQYHAVLMRLERLDRAGIPLGTVVPRFNNVMAPSRPGIPQWHQEKDGNWISEKNPGYPFLAVPFYDLGIIRLAPLFYGLLACVGLFFGARVWLRRRFAGAAAVALYVSSGAAVLFAWRDYMPTFTEASLLAAGSGAILWAVLAVEARPWHRTVVGLLGFVALEAAAFTRYTDILVVGVAAVAVIAVRGRDAVRVPAMAMWWWLGSVVVFAAGLAAFDSLVYGGPTSTGYAPGEITFSLSAVWPNLRLLPRYLVEDMPVLFIALAGGAWITVRYIRSRWSADGGDARRDLAAGAALAASWLSIWALYLAYTWTAANLLLTTPPAAGVEMVRFYVPALGDMALLGAWVLVRLPRWLMLTAVVALGGLGYRSFTEMTTLDLPPILWHMILKQQQ
jgi:hypothetical protein